MTPGVSDAASSVSTCVYAATTHGEATTQGLVDGALLHAGEVEEGTCAICLDAIPEADVAMVTTCLHGFCTPCIMRWCTFELETAARRLTGPAKSSDPTCPCCKAPFSSLLVYRTLDGAVQADLREESVCLLRRARWLSETAKAAAWDRDVVAATAATHGLRGGHSDSGYFREDYEVYDEDYLEDEEDYMAGLYSRRGGGRGVTRGGAGRSRGGGSAGGIVIGNRRFGANGYIAQGQRMHARPVPQQQAVRGKGDRGKGKGACPGEERGNAQSDAAGAGGKSSVADDGSSSSARTLASDDDVVSSPASAASSAGIAPKGKKAAKRAEAKAKKEEKEAARRAKRAESMAAANAAKAARKAAGSGSGLQAAPGDEKEEADGGGGVAGEGPQVAVAPGSSIPESGEGSSRSAAPSSSLGAGVATATAAEDEEEDGGRGDDEDVIFID